MGVWAEELILELDDLPEWPAPAHRRALKAVSRGIALRDRDEQTIRAMAGWDTGRRQQQPMILDPMPRRISSAFSSLIFGREPEFTAAVDDDQARMDALVEGNNFKSELSRAARTASSEGEVWWRLYVDLDIADVPILEWHSRTSVYPLWQGWRLLAVAFVTRLRDVDGYAYRHFEVHDYDRERGAQVQNILYAEKLSTVDDTIERTRQDPDRHPARPMRLGERVPLTDHPETELLMERWDPGVSGMLAGRVANLLDTDPTIGTSDYADIEDFLVELSVAASIGHSNLEMTARKRAIVPEEEVEREQGVVDLGETVYVDRDALRDLGEGGGGSGSKFKVLEYSFDADALIAYTKHIERTSLNRIGIDAQYAGIDAAEGRAESGTALRIRLIPSDAAAAERAQEWDDQLPKALSLMQQLDALPVENRGFGRPWQGAADEPGVERGAALPEDRTEGTERRSAAVGAKIMARRTAIEEDHPEWDDDRVDEELKLIEADMKADKDAAANPFAATIPGVVPPGEGEDDDQEVPAEGKPEPEPVA